MVSAVVVYTARGLPEGARRIDRKVFLSCRPHCFWLPTVALPTAMSAEDGMLAIFDRDCFMEEGFEACLPGLGGEFAAVGFVVD